MIEFVLEEDFIELIRLLKYLHIAQTGGHAKILVDEGMIKLNGQTEYRKRAKLHKGDVVETENIKIVIV